MTDLTSHSLVVCQHCACREQMQHDLSLGNFSGTNNNKLRVTRRVVVYVKVTKQ